VRSGRGLAPLVVSILGLLTALGVSAQSELDVSARLQPSLIGLEELAHLSIEVKGEGFGGRGFDPKFELENLDIAGGPSTSTSFRLDNGVASRSLTLTWLLKPRATGVARVHSFQVQIGETLFSPPDLEIEVQQDAVGRQEARSGRSRDPFESFFPRLDTRQRRRPEQPKVFLRAEVEPRQPYVGQQALYTLFLFTQVDVESINPEKLPDFQGFWVRELDQPANANLEMVDIDGERFGKVAVLRRAIFPLRAGPLELGPAKVQLTLRIPDQTFGQMFSTTEQVRRDSNGLALDVRDLPVPAPEGYAGAVGDLKVAAELDPAEVAIGDAATYSVTLSGIGHIQGLPAPTLPEIPGLRSFPPQQESDERVIGDRVHGRRTWSFVLVPETPGDFDLPPVEISFFDPARGEFATARAAEARFRAIAAAAPIPVPALEAAFSETVDDMAEAARPSSQPVDWPRVLPWVLVVLLGATLTTVLLRRGHGHSSHPLPDFHSALRKAGHKSKPREAAALIEDAWRAFLEARWNIPPSTPSTQWSRRLGEVGAPMEAADRLVELADDLHYLRYAPQLSDTAALKKELIVRSTKLGRTLK